MAAYLPRAHIGTSALNATATTAAQVALRRPVATNPTPQVAEGTTKTGIESHPRAPFAPTGRRSVGAHSQVVTNPPVYPCTSPQKLSDSRSHFIINRPNESPTSMHHHCHSDSSMQPAPMHDTIPRPIYTYYFPSYLDGKYRCTQDLLVLDACYPRATDPEAAQEMRRIISPLCPMLGPRNSLICLTDDLYPTSCKGCDLALELDITETPPSLYQQSPTCSQRCITSSQYKTS